MYIWAPKAGNRTAVAAQVQPSSAMWDAGWAFLLSYSCHSLGAQEWTGPVSCHVTRHHTDLSDTRYRLKRLLLFSFPLAQLLSNTTNLVQMQLTKHRCWVLEATESLLQPYRLCRPNLLRLWCPLMCPQRHLCASPRSNRDISCLKEWCHQLKLTFFRYHPKASRVLIKNSIKFLFIVEFSQKQPNPNHHCITPSFVI